MNTKRLSQCSPEYLAILYIIWQLVSYYGKLFQVIAGNEPAKTIARITQEDGITHIYFSYPKVQNSERGYTVLEMRDIYNDYLRMVLLPAQKSIVPFHGGKELYEVVESLYVNLVYEDSGYINLDIIYVDNPIAYKYVREDEKVTFRRI